MSILLGLLPFLRAPAQSSRARVLDQPRIMHEEKRAASAPLITRWS